MVIELTERLRPISHVGFVLGLGLLLACGCSDRGIHGGTAGKLTSADIPLGQMQLTVHQQTGADYQPLGTGFTAVDGIFELATLDASAPLLLPAGEYRWTIESVGAEVLIPNEYQTPQASPLQTSWTGDGMIDLRVPTLKPLSVQRR